MRSLFTVLATLSALWGLGLFALAGVAVVGALFGEASGVIAQGLALALAYYLGLRRG